MLAANAFYAEQNHASKHLFRINKYMVNALNEKPERITMYDSVLSLACCFSLVAF